MDRRRDAPAQAFRHRRCGIDTGRADHAGRAPRGAEIALGHLRRDEGFCRPRARKLAPQEYQGGSSAVSNLGMYGIKDFYAIINPPHATILSVGAAEERAVARNGKIEAAHMMTVGLATDHRAVDGALGAVLLNAFKALIENPVMMVV